MLKYSGDKFLKKDRFPMFWCSGCGNGILLGCIVRAMEESGFTRENTVVVTGIGCWGKADDYLTTHSFHGTHGRAIPIATGIKLANPDLNVIALVGDGDGLTIGGNHIIHAAGGRLRYLRRAGVRAFGFHTRGRKHPGTGGLRTFNKGNRD